ncbi:MAG: hypothetical protein ACI8VT_004422, partial [Saprospiraceae bacterium]
KSVTCMQFGLRFCDIFEFLLIRKENFTLCR